MCFICGKCGKCGQIRGNGIWKWKRLIKSKDRKKHGKLNKKGYPQILKEKISENVDIVDS